MHWIRRAVCVTLTFSLSLASGEIIAPDGLNPESIYGKDSNQGVYVRESAVALEKFALAQRMEGHREWDKSADVFQEILENYPDRVVPSQLDADKNIYQYTSVTLAVQERLARWPVEGLNVYRSRYETTAASMLEQAKWQDFSSLHRIFSIYFVTDSAKQAGIRLVDMYFESGEFPAAAWLGDRLLKWHPNLFSERPAVLYRTGLAYHLAGDSQNASRILKELKEHHGQATGVIRGVDVHLAESLEKAFDAPPPVSTAMIADSWPTFGGSPDRARISSAAGRPGAKLFSIDLVKPGRMRNFNPDQLRELEQTDQAHRDSGMMLGVFPSLDNGELFFQDNARVYAVSLESGVPLPGWAATYGGQRPGQYSINAWPLPRNQQLTVTLTDNSVLAIMGLNDPLALQMGAAGIRGESETRLVCLDRQTGKENWAVTTKQLGATLKNVRFTGSPLVVGENVYVVGRGGQGMQFEDCYVICLSLTTGQPQWNCYIASANTGNQMWGGQSITFASTSHLAYSSGRLYILTNLGALAAVDAYSGAIQWLNIYPRDIPNEFEGGPIGLPRRNMATSTGDARPWSQNPVMVQGGKVFVLPSDSKYILVYDAANGIEAQRIRLTDLRNCDTLLAVNGSDMIVSGESMSGGQAIGLLYHFDWVKYRPGSINDRESDLSVLHWWRDFPTPISGRGFVTSDSIFIPTTERLYRVGMHTGKVEEGYPRYPTIWKKGEDPGNVIVTQDQVIIAGSRRVDVFTDMQVARAKLDAQVAAAPSDPDARLRYAEVMFVAGERQIAMQKLDEAITLLGGIGTMRAGPGRDRVFNDALTFAQKLSDEDKAEWLPMAMELFDRAGDSAGTASQKVNYRVSRARFAHRNEDFAAEAALYQEILSDPEMRAVPLSDTDASGAQQAAVVAERAIAGLIKNTGPDCYAPFEAAAADQLAAAMTASDPAKLLAVAQVYPNSSVAPRAMFAAADAYESAGNPRLATQVLRRVYFKYPDSPQKLSIIEAMARNYLRMNDRVDVAIARLAHAARIEPTRRLDRPLALPDGQLLSNATVGEALATLQKLQQPATVPQLPDFHLPMPLPRNATPEERQSRKNLAPFVLDEDASVPNVTNLVLPLTGYQRNDRLLAYSPKGLDIYEPGSSTPLFTITALSSQPVQCAWTGNQLLVWSTSEMIALSLDSGDVKWKFNLSGLQAVEVVQLDGQTVDDSPVLPRVIAADQDGVFIHDNEGVLVGNDIQRQRQIIRIQAARLAMMPAVPQEPNGGAEQIAHVAPTDDRIILGTNTGRVVAIDPTTGRTEWQTRFAARRMDRLVATDDFTVAMTLDDTHVYLTAIETFEGAYVNRLKFAIDGGAIPINLALSRDGMLVFTLPDRLCGKDLFEPGSRWNYPEPQQAQGNALFHGASKPGQLLIDDGRVLAVSDNGQFVRVHSLQTGEILKFSSDAGSGIALLKTEAKDWNVQLRLGGSYMYAMGQHSLLAYNLDALDDPRSGWDKPVDWILKENFIDAFVGQDYLLILDKPAQGKAPENAGRMYRLHGCSRARVEGHPNRESGVWPYTFELPDIPQPGQWQAVEGGFYYLSADGTLQFLRGARQEPLVQ
jgi:outer membrane protein assembly factor BamB